MVLMILMILSAIGTFAATNARFETQTAGFERQRQITHEVVTFGAFAAMDELGAATQGYFDKVQTSGSTDPTKKETCTSNATLASAAAPYPPCFHIYPLDIEKRLGYAAGLFAPPDPDAGMPGSLGLGSKTSSGVKSGLNGGFFAEITEPYQYGRPVPGYQINDAKAGVPTFFDFTVTSNGFVFYDSDLDGKISAYERGGATYGSGRGHAIIGPIIVQPPMGP